MTATASAPKRKPRVDREQRAKAYLAAAAGAFLAKGAAATMQQIADAADAPKPVFYRIYPSRERLIEALFQHVHDVIADAQAEPWQGYGWTLKAVYLRARQDPEIFLAVLKVFRAMPAHEAWRERLLDLVHQQSTAFFTPSEGAPRGAGVRAVRASKSLESLFFDTLATWLENRDGLSDEARFRWWGRIIREWRKATREAYELDAPAAGA
jgi:AcrR family transcriptional regulator